MAKNIIILGAGASAQYGAPVMCNFLEKAKELRTQGKLSEEATPALARIIDVLYELQRGVLKSKIDLENLESILSLLEMAEIFEKLPGFCHTEIPEIVAGFKLVISETLHQTMRGRSAFLKPLKGYSSNPVERTESEAFPPSEISDLLKEIKKRNTRMEKHDTAIISFNYDLLFDLSIQQTLQRATQRTPHGAPLDGSTVDYGFGESLSTASILLLKLHGSLNWFVDPKSNEIFTIPLGNTRSFRPIITFARFTEFGTMLRGAAKERLTDGENDRISPMIVPPSWSKIEAYKRIKAVWARAAAELSDAEHIFIVGYSLPPSDSFFQSLYSIGTIGRELIRSFYVYDISDSSKKRFLDLIGPGVEKAFKMNVCDATHAFEDIAQKIGTQV